MRRLFLPLFFLCLVNFACPVFSFCSDIRLPDDVLELIQKEQKKGALRELQCSIPLGGKRSEVIQVSFYPEGKRTGPIQHAGSSPEEKEYNASTGTWEVIGTQHYTIRFEPPFSAQRPPLHSRQTAPLTSPQRAEFHRQAVCQQLGLDPRKNPMLCAATHDDDSDLDLSD